MPRSSTPAVPVLPVRIGTAEDDPGRRRVHRRGGNFVLSTAEAMAGVPLLAMDNDMDASMKIDATAAGHRGLHDRGLIRIRSTPPAQPGDTLSASADASTAIGWGYPDAAPELARRLSLPLNKLGGRATTMLTQAAYVLDGSRAHPLSGIEVAIVLRHRYQFTGVHAVTLTIPDASLANGTDATSGADETAWRLVEHRHDQPDRVRTIGRVPAVPGRLRQAAASHETDIPRVLLPTDVEAMVLDAFTSGGATSHGRATSDVDVRFDLDRLAVGGEESWMPALLRDVLAHLRVRASATPTPVAFLDWAREHLRYTVRCGAFTHVRHIDPDTGALSTPAQVIERQAAEDMLAALQLPVGERVGCAVDAEFLHAVLDTSILDRISDETLVRWLVRAAQYIEAGIDLRAAADFWFFAIPAPLVPDLLAWRRDDEAAVTNLLFGWCRDVFTKGTFTVPQRPTSH